MKQGSRIAVVLGLIIGLAGIAFNAQAFRPGREMGKERNSGIETHRKNNAEDNARTERALPMPPDVTTSFFNREVMEAGKDSPFGFFDPNMLRYKHDSWYEGYGKVMNDLGARWASYGATFCFRWNLIQGKNEDGTYTEPRWERHDRLVKGANAYNIHIIGIIRVSEPVAGEGGGRVTPALPKDMAGYKTFVKEVIERYDGDGKDDMPGLEYPIKYWLIEDEPMSPKYFKGTGGDYAVLLSAAYGAVKSADADANVVCAMVRETGLRGRGDPRAFTEDFFRKLAEMGKNRPYDIIDQHWIGGEDSFEEYSFYKGLIDDINNTSRKYGFAPAPFVAIEIAGFHNTTEEMQAADLLRRHVILLSLGVKKIFWSGIKAAPAEGLNKEQRNNYFRNVTLIKGDGEKKTAYWTYKLMVETLEGSDWEKTQVNKTGDGVYIFTFMKKGLPVWVACNNAGEAKVRIAAGKDIKRAAVIETVPDVNKGGSSAGYLNLFRRTEAAVKDGVLEITVGETPLIITGE